MLQIFRGGGYCSELEWPGNTAQGGKWDLSFILKVSGIWKGVMEEGGDSRVGKQHSQSQPEGNPLFSIFKIYSVDLTRY